MLPGATLIVVCPHCRAPHRLVTRTNVETDGTDGTEFRFYAKTYASMWQNQRMLVKCAVCARVCRLDEMPWVGHSEPWGDVLLREPLSFDVVIVSAWDDLDLAARNLAYRLSCSVPDVARWLRTLPFIVAKDILRVEAEALAEEYWELGVDAETAPCRVCLEPPPKEWRRAPSITLDEVPHEGARIPAGKAETI